MPLITVEYSDHLADAFDRRGFGLELHPLISRTLDIPVARCRTRFYRVTESLAGDGSEESGQIRVVVALRPGRSNELKSELTQAVLALTREWLRPRPGQSLGQVHLSVDIQDLGEAFAMHLTETTV